MCVRKEELPWLLRRGDAGAAGPLPVRENETQQLVRRAPAARETSAFPHLRLKKEAKQLFERDSRPRRLPAGELVIGAEELLGESAPVFQKVACGTSHTLAIDSGGGVWARARRPNSRVSIEN